MSWLGARVARGGIAVRGDADGVDATGAGIEGPLGELARVAAFVAGGTACFRDTRGEVLGSAGLLDAESYDLGTAGADDGVVVADTTLDLRYAGHPLVVGPPFVRSWASLPVYDANGATIARLELADVVSRLVSDDRLAALTTVAQQAGLRLASRPTVAPARDGGPMSACRDALSHVPTPIYFLRVEGPPSRPSVRFIDGNAAARRITSPETLGRLGASVDDIFPWASAHGVTERCLRVRQTGEIEDFQLPLSIGPGSRLMYAVRVFPLPHDHLGVAVEDVTGSTELQRRKDELVTVLSHELRTPLSAIRGAVGLLEGGVAGPLSDNAARLVGMAREGSERLSRILSDLLDLERLRAGLLPLRAEPVAIGELVQTAVSALTGAARAAGVSVEDRVDQDGSVVGDRERLAQALTNLLSNAVKFSPSGGVVRVRVSRPEPRRVRVEVSDDGRGLSPDDAERIFTPFQPADLADTRARGGLGLGLAISRFIVEGHGGAVGVVSAHGAGATFWIELPILSGPG